MTRHSIRRGLAAALLGALAALGAAAPARAATFKLLHAFDGAHGAAPIGAVAIDAAGNVVGTASAGGKYGHGVLFRWSAGKYAVLHHFRGGRRDGATPMGSLFIDATGAVYGTTFAGGRANAGTLFRLDAAGLYTVLASLDGTTQGSAVVAGIAGGADGMLYGAASHGGASGQDAGTLFKADPTTGAITVIHTFDRTDGAWPESTPSWSNGQLVGTAWGGTIYTLAPDGSGFRVVDFGATDNSLIYAGVTVGASGDWWGAMDVNGTDSGDLWHIAPDGSFAFAHYFNDPAQHDGANPTGTLWPAADGGLYGTTRAGGGGCNCGTVFRFDPVTGVLATVHDFVGTDGTEPWAGVVGDASGNLYGVTEYGGTSGNGALFRITP